MLGMACMLRMEFGISCRTIRRFWIRRRRGWGFCGRRTKKGTWTLHAHWGMFAGRFGPADVGGDSADGWRGAGDEYGVQPDVVCESAGGRDGDPEHAHGCAASGEHAVGCGEYRRDAGAFRMAGIFRWITTLARFWNYTRSENVNSPLNGVPTGPRPGPANLNVLQMQNSGQGRANAVFAAVEQHTLKRVQFFFGGVRVELVDDTDDNQFFTPQSSRSNAGEFAHRSGQSAWNLFGNGTVKLPEKIELERQLQWRQRRALQHYDGLR